MEGMNELGRQIRQLGVAGTVTGGPRGEFRCGVEATPLSPVHTPYLYTTLELPPLCCSRQIIDV